MIGIDLGLNRPVVLSNHQFLGERRWKEQERRISRLRRKLQKKGTTSACLAGVGTSSSVGIPVTVPIVSTLRG